MNAKAVLAVALIAVTAACSGRDPAIPSNATDVPLEQMGPTAPQGQSSPGYYSHSGFNESARLVIRDQQGWADAWATLMQPSPGADGPPQVDFQADMVLLAAMGWQSNGGYSIALDDAAKTDAMFYISVTETSPGAHCITAQVITQPVALVRVPRFDGEVKFIENTKTTNCF
jgi:hypothetical protein